MHPAFTLQLVESARNGDEEAWNILYQHYYPKLYATALRICGAVPETKDLIQDSFVTAYLKLSQLKEISNFESWVRKILMRNCYRLINRNRKRTQTYLNTITEQQLKEDIELQFEKFPLFYRLYNVLSELSESLRSVVLLHYFSSFTSYNEIATILSIPVGTVRSRLNEARAKLTDKWKQPLSKSTYNKQECEEWNHFYFETYSNLHFNDNEKNKFLHHLGKSVKIFFPGGMLDVGYRAFENLIIDDKKHGSWLQPIQVLTCGNISVIEAVHFNSAEHPNHCPPKSIAVLYRKKMEVVQLNLHLTLS